MENVLYILSLLFSNITCQSVLPVCRGWLSRQFPDPYIWYRTFLSAGAVLVLFRHRRCRNY
ncbi:hypothetical protein HMPREF1548_05419 [Clostridium sp. KLE 1755]|nr:hypothetical protein HMPREF1548_05419 [Clostridium sp. KLE 1755]